MVAGVVIGVLGFLIWLFWALRTKNEYKGEILRAYLWLGVGMMFELGDFEPILGVFDAHSIWHLSTIFTTALFYDFLIKDALALNDIDDLKLN